MLAKISQAAFDELHEILGAVANEDSYHRWVQNGAIRVCDIWDVFVQVPGLVVIDWRASPEEIIEEIGKAAPDVRLNADVTYEQLEIALRDYNKRGAGAKVMLFGRSWNDSDTVLLICLSNEGAARIFSHQELSQLFTVL